MYFKLSSDKGWTNGCLLHWNIKNFRHCCFLGEEVELVSPTIKGWNGTEWYLQLRPIGDRVENSIGFSLCRAEGDDGPHEVLVRYHLAFLSKEGSVLNGLYGKMELKKGEGDGRQNFESRKRVFFAEKERFLPEGTLTVQCMLHEIWEDYYYSMVPHLKHVCVRSVFKVNRRSVLWKIANCFSPLNSSVKNKFKENLIDLDLILNKKILEMNVISYDDSVKCISVNISIRKRRNFRNGVFGDSKMHWSISAVRENDDGEFDDRYYITHLPAKKLLLKQRQYMFNGVLSLDIDYVYTTLTSEFLGSGMLSPEEKSKNAPVLKDYLKSMYKDGVFSDTKLCTSSQTFPAHRGILSVRSPVFSRMFSNDMKEKSSGCVNIADLEDDTVHRMLLFMYTDLLENLQFESALKLYEASDKYEILSLKNRCSLFLKDSMRPIRACRVLVLADLHQDEDLKSFVQAYILKHDDVFSLDQWKQFIEKNPKLAADIMYRKICPSNA